jgi:hypothetical protein
MMRVHDQHRDWYHNQDSFHPDMRHVAVPKQVRNMQGSGISLQHVDDAQLGAEAAVGGDQQMKTARSSHEMVVQCDDKGLSCAGVDMVVVDNPVASIHE